MYVAGRAHWKISLDEPRVLRVVLYVRDACGLTPLTRPAIPPLDPGTDRWPVWARPRTVTDPVPLTANQRAIASVQWVRWWEHALAEGPMAWQDVTDGTLSAFARLPELRRVIAAHRTDAVEWASASADDPRFSRDKMPAGSRLSALVATLERERGRPARRFDLRVTVLPVEGKQAWELTPDHLLVTARLLHDDEIMLGWLRSVLSRLV